MTQDNPSERPTMQLLPWQGETAAQLRKAWAARRLPHALLLQGAEGLGKRSFAAWLTGAVLCDSSRGDTLDCCGHCASCALIKAGSHPDLLWVIPEEDKQQIAVDQVRTATERLTHTSYRQGYKVAIIDPAHQMTPGAANSVLKTLEEPAPNSLLVLITSRPSALLPTVRSRCQKLTMARPAAAAIAAWVQERTGQPLDTSLLEFAGAAPLRALQYAGGTFAELNEQMQRSLGALLMGQADLTQVAAEWEKDRLSDRLTWLDLWLCSLARRALAGNDDLVTFPRESKHLPRLTGPLNISAIYEVVDRARALKAQLARTALQRELAVESWLIALLEVLAAAVTGASGARE